MSHYTPKDVTPPLITEEELTAFLWQHSETYKKPEGTVYAAEVNAAMAESRALARRMLACDLMYEALAEIREETKNGKLPLTQWIYRRSAAALKAAEEGRRDGK